MGEGSGSWPNFRTDITAARGQARAYVADTVDRSSQTHSELTAQVEQLTQQIHVLSVAVNSQRVVVENYAHDQQLHHELRQDVSAQVEHLAAHVETCVAGLSHLEENVEQRLSETEVRITDAVLEIQLEQSGVINEVIDLRSLQVEFGDHQVETIVENGRLHQELRHEVSQLRAVVEESRELAEKANYQASSASANNDALQAEFDEAQRESERRLDVLKSLIEQVDHRSYERAQTTNNFVADTINQTNAKVAQVGAAVTARDQRLVSSTATIAARIRELESRLASFEQRRPSQQFPTEQPPSSSPAPTAVVAQPEPTFGWQFERRSRRAQNLGL